MIAPDPQPGIQESLLRSDEDRSCGRQVGGDDQTGPSLDNAAALPTDPPLSPGTGTGPVSDPGWPQVSTPQQALGTGTSRAALWPCETLNATGAWNRSCR